jgi:hypothetical protein
VETYSQVPFFRLNNKMPNGFSEMRDLDFFDLMYVETEGGAGVMVIRVISDFLKTGQWPNWYDSWPMIIDGERVALKSTTIPDFQSNYELRVYELPVDVFSKLCNAKEVRYSLRGQSRKTEGAFSSKHMLLFKAFQEYCFGDESQGKMFLDNIIRPIEKQKPAHDIMSDNKSEAVGSTSIKGIIQRENGNPVKGVKLILCIGNEEFKAHSNLDGTFEIKNLPQVKFDLLIIELDDEMYTVEENDLSTLKLIQLDFGIIKLSNGDAEMNILRQPEISTTEQSVINSVIESSLLSEDLESKINSILKNSEGLNILGKKLYFKGGIDPKKWRNFTNQYKNFPIGNIDDCYVYFDSTVFGSGDDGFMLTKNLFCWKNIFDKATCLYNHSAVEGFNQKAETIRFYNLNGNDIGVVNGASMHEAGESPGFKVNSNKSLIDIAKTVEVLNKLLQVIKAS